MGREGLSSTGDYVSKPQEYLAIMNTNTERRTTSRSAKHIPPIPLASIPIWLLGSYHEGQDDLRQPLLQRGEAPVVHEGEDVALLFGVALLSSAGDLLDHVLAGKRKGRSVREREE